MNEKYLGEMLPDAVNIEALPIEASTRSFFRISNGEDTSVAMVFPEDSEETIARIEKLTALYSDAGLKVPETVEVVNNRILIQQDLGDQMLDSFYAECPIPQQKYLLREIGDIVMKLAEIPVTEADRELGKSRMKWEMDFFMDHFATSFLNTSSKSDLKNKLYKLVDKLEEPSVFAHRDLHSRNMLFRDNRIWLVDYQDSLAAPQYYDLVSSVYDSYLDISLQRVYLFGRLAMEDYIIDFDQLHLTALQRNIKALGTFGYQINVRKNIKYREYINRTLGYIKENPKYSELFIPEDFSTINLQ